ncbi:unnamed protein product [Cylindrotheca closterium]|uniref:Uncharacterized protein n=1 Tax=Cylindrotheca closterium TaxID=2856 RepID=A0AAD2CQS5_9STRA|nr:unnamed protein product [Cylindrotheca closterium]
MKADPDACSKVDFVGMTPFHVLGLSQMPCLRLFQEPLSIVSSVDIIMRSQDIFGCTPLDYLFKNRSSHAVNVTKSLLPVVLKPRVSILGLPQWREELRSSLGMVDASDAVSIASEVASVCRKLAVHKWMEAQSLLEIALWGSKVTEQFMGLHKAGDCAAIVLESDQTLVTARENTCINCGINLVLSTRGTT